MKHRANIQQNSKSKQFRAQILPEKLDKMLNLVKKIKAFLSGQREKWTYNNGKICRHTEQNEN